MLRRVVQQVAPLAQCGEAATRVVLRIVVEPSIAADCRSGEAAVASGKCETRFASRRTPLMRLAALALVALVAGSGEGWADGKLSDVEVTPGKVTPHGAATSATFIVRNKRGTLIPHMYVTCSLLDEQGSPKDVTEQPVTNIESGQTVYGSLFFSNTTEGGALTCRASEVD